MTQNEALKLALEAFETLTQYNMVRANIFRRFEPTCTGDYVDLREFREKAKPAITAIKEALSSPNGEAQPEQEPVAWMDKDGERVVSAVQKAGMHKSLQASFPIALGYTTPPQRTWVGLTTDEYDAAIVMDSIEAAVTFVEAKLKEKNT